MAKKSKYQKDNSKRIYQKKDKFKLKFYALKSRAKSRGIEFSLVRSSFDQWYAQQPRQCAYCGVQEEDLKKAGRSKSLLSVDRRNNNLGYCLDNLAVACCRCNNSKSDFFSAEEWTEIADTYIKPRLKEYHSLG